MIISILNCGSPLVLGSLVLSGLLLSGCAGRLPPEERARLRAEQERTQLERALSRIYPIGKEEHRRLSKEEAYLACNQKSEAAVNEAAQAEEIRQTIEYKNKSGGNYVGGVAQGLTRAIELKDAKDKARGTAMKSCLIDYGYIMR